MKINIQPVEHHVIFLGATQTTIFSKKIKFQSCGVKSLNVTHSVSQFQTLLKQQIKKHSINKQNKLTFISVIPKYSTLVIRNNQFKNSFHIFLGKIFILGPESQCSQLQMNQKKNFIVSCKSTQKDVVEQMRKVQKSLQVDKNNSPYLKYMPFKNQIKQQPNPITSSFSYTGDIQIECLDQSKMSKSVRDFINSKKSQISKNNEPSFVLDVNISVIPQKESIQQIDSQNNNSILFPVGQQKKTNQKRIDFLDQLDKSQFNSQNGISDKAQKTYQTKTFLQKYQSQEKLNDNKNYLIKPKQEQDNKQMKKQQQVSINLYNQFPKIDTRQEPEQSKQQNQQNKQQQNQQKSQKPSEKQYKQQKQQKYTQITQKQDKSKIQFLGYQDKIEQAEKSIINQNYPNNISYIQSEEQQIQPQHAHNSYIKQNINDQQDDKQNNRQTPILQNYIYNIQEQQKKQKDQQQISQQQYCQSSKDQQKSDQDKKQQQQQKLQGSFEQQQQQQRSQQQQQQQQSIQQQQKEQDNHSDQNKPQAYHKNPQIEQGIKNQYKENNKIQVSLTTQINNQPMKLQNQKIQIIQTEQASQKTQNVYASPIITDKRQQHPIIDQQFFKSKQNKKTIVTDIYQRKRNPEYLRKLKKNYDKINKCYNKNEHNFISDIHSYGITQNMKKLQKQLSQLLTEKTNNQQLKQLPQFKNIEILWADPNNNNATLESLRLRLKHKIKITYVVQPDLSINSQIITNSTTEYLIICSNRTFGIFMQNHHYPFPNCEQYFVFCGSQNIAYQNLDKYSTSNNTFITTDFITLINKVSQVAQKRYYQIFNQYL